MEISTKFAEELEKRRQRIFEQMPNSSVAILPGAGTQYRSGDAEYPFRQNSNFYYLTGFTEADAIGLLIKDEAGMAEFILFCKASHPEEEVWTGPRVGLKGAREVFGANKAFDIDEVDERLPLLIANHNNFFYTLGQDAAFDKKILAFVQELRAKNRKGVSIPKVWIDLKAIIDRLRMKKSPYEIDLMQKAANISAEAHMELIQKCAAGLFEYQLEAEFLYYCYAKGVRAMAYNPIVGGGENACILHYNNNDKILKTGELVLVDAGCEYQYYAADITRVFPVGGKFSKEQKAIYELVLKSQVAAIQMIRPGVAWDRLQEVIVEILTEGLLALGLLNPAKGDLKTLIQEKAYQTFYMHSSGHWLGLDVHDVGEYKVNNKWIVLEPGMVLTVEPGIYIAEGQKNIDKAWWGIGVRIEDDVLVTETGYKVLSEKVPKTVDEIEALMAKGIN